VTGTVFAAGTKLKVVPRLIAINTGRVVAAAEAEIAREWPGFDVFAGLDSGERAALSPDLALPDMLPGFSDRAMTMARAENNFRDSVLDPETVSCAERKLRLNKTNSELVDAKARHWAVSMKEPGFSARNLTRNPGSEIGDPATKALFYKLLAGYYSAETLPTQDQGRLADVKELIATEKVVSNECGLY
jgi:hypothetical protein